MKLTKYCLWIAAVLCAVAWPSATVAAESGALTVHVDQPGIAVSPVLYGLMTEEINHSYDGGLYGELIANRSLKDNATEPVRWSAVTSGGGAGTVSLDPQQPLNPDLPTSLKLDIVQPGDRVGAANSGWWGIPVQPKTNYTASFYAKSGNGFTGPLTVDIETNDGATVFASATVQAITDGWEKYTVKLSTGDVSPSEANRFVISAKSSGTVWLALVSLFPPTYDGTPNGNRNDLMTMLGAMKPSFLRLPGGNYLEGDSLANYFDWKRTIGPLENRPGHPGPWGYRSSDGLGLLEYLEWCEDLHMQPVLAVFAGYALNGQYVQPGPALEPYVQDALDEIQYVSGSAQTKWGAERAADGHPKPFPLTYVEISNEDGGHDYEGRFAQFFDAIRAKYPKLKIIATSRVKSRTPDLVDEHFYRSAAAMEADSHHYDTYDRKGPKIFVGEWASTEGKPTPTLNAALGDAAWMIGMERNSDIVKIEAYAPLLVNVNPGASQWGTNLIGYDALHSFGSPSYYAQVMFSNNRGDVVLPTDVRVQSSQPRPHPMGQIGVGTWNTQAEFRNITVTHGGTVLAQPDLAKGDSDWKIGDGTWTDTNGVLTQTSAETPARATFGDPHWTDYTVTLQARKTGGAEGFLILVHSQGDDNYVWWNIGGWGNTRTAFEQARDGSKNEIGMSSPVTVKTGQWYSIRIVVAGGSMRGYLDNKLVSQASETNRGVASIYAEATRDKKRGDVILKVVNTSASAQSLQINLAGARQVAKSGEEIVLAGDPDDVNTLDNPLKVAPKESTLTGAAQSFTHEFPAHSVSVLRINVR